MTFDSEWATLRAESTQRVDMRLNGVLSGPGSPDEPSSADLAVNQDSLATIGHEAYALRTRLTADSDCARVSTFDASTKLTNGNFDCGSGLLKVHDQWNTHRHTLLDACAQISNHLNYTKSAHQKDDVQIGADLISVSKLNEYMK
ncbi:MULTISPECIES: hypothetical protein [unclassified Streptomyces]|uniref:hypothetical protein n=1 Tax=unclassified Streptomyces TaxID=2593676 RepID=UPI000939E020|nr:hypothetical protein [Streptomyces sp. TSRI0281]OKI38643.1 hypothetical protein A6A29_11415 [Streptomyces sp. TSRI0281]